MNVSDARHLLNRIKDGDTTVSDVEVALALKVTGDLNPNLEKEDGNEKEHNPLVSWTYQTREGWRVPTQSRS